MKIKKEVKVILFLCTVLVSATAPLMWHYNNANFVEFSFVVPFYADATHMRYVVKSGYAPLFLSYSEMKRLPYVIRDSGYKGVKYVEVQYYSSASQYEGVGIKTPPAFLGTKSYKIEVTGE
jgi:hypothetical protein